ncbi:MAG TPA: cbb3-type cytochrome c oxidase subunit I, partial [Steroidobacteraceae bacterium]|nr:cbb3-type cytochrome c oxidase subunit I [Steroidobacteraceae bacterium]
KQAQRPIYSYRLSVVHFWALIFTYMWAGPHHLHYTALPDWAQSLGMLFSLILLAPSWGGMINGIMTLSGAWHKLRTDPILKFLITSLSFYGMATFEGPMMSIKTVNALSHYTDWTVGHVHAGALGWVAMISIGCVYYLVPRMYGGTQMYSTSLITLHFWALIFTYMWAGPHHLHYTALPDWAQSIGMLFSLVLLAPSWGGMINGIMTLSGAWHKLRDDPILKFLIVSLSFYGMSTFEGPMMSIKTVNALSHYTDWTIGHVHSGALGWVAMISIGSLYALLPRLYGQTQMASTRAIDVHFWVMTVGIVLYIASMWIAGVMQGLMWRATNSDGTLTYTFVESLAATYPYYAVRLLGGLLVLAGMFIMVHNVWRTIAGRAPAHDVTVPQPA